jgi:hypothetical protein
MALHKISQHQLPLVMFGAGLPQIIGRLVSLRHIVNGSLLALPWGPLNPSDAAKAIWAPVEKAHVFIGKRAVEQIVNVTQCYPYFLQTWGYPRLELRAWFRDRLKGGSGGARRCHS